MIHLYVTEIATLPHLFLKNSIVVVRSQSPVQLFWDPMDCSLPRLSVPTQGWKPRLEPMSPTWQVDSLLVSYLESPFYLYVGVKIAPVLW